MAEFRKSRQRDAVYADLCSRTDHPTAEEVYESVKRDYPSIGIATVYRNLKVLVDMGLARVVFTGTSDHFDADVTPHYHMYCTDCGRIYDIDIPEIPEIRQAAEALDDCDISSYSLVYQGICGRCLGKKE